MTSPHFLLAIVHRIFQQSISQSFQGYFRHHRIWRLIGLSQSRWGCGGRAALIAAALLLLGSNPAWADTTILSFDLVRGQEKRPSPVGLAQHPKSSTSPARIISSADGKVLTQQGDVGVGEAVAQRSLVISPPKATRGGELGGGISLHLSNPALVAAAPLAVAQSVEQQLGREFGRQEAEGREREEELKPAERHRSESAKALTHKAEPLQAEIPEDWWHQGAASPIAVAIGHAEGTRRADGGKTTAYYWHVDPGNGADNFGTFSYQHFPPALTVTVRRQATPLDKRDAAAQAQLPEMADHEQMQRLRQFYDELQAQAAAHQIQLSQLEIMNGLDLANQSEAAALSVEGYIDRLAQMKMLEEDLEEQILEARAWSYWDPELRRWNAPGLGNTYENVRRDQERRYGAIRSALESYPSAKADISQHARVGKSERVSTASPVLDVVKGAGAATGIAFGEAIANRIIDFNLPS